MSAAQDAVGNGAVAAARGSEPEARSSAPAGTARPGPGADPKFAALKEEVRRKRRSVASSHPPPRAEAAAAQNAAVPPGDDVQAQGKAANAEKMNEARPKEFDKDAFIKAVEKAIADKAPKNLDEADGFAESGKADEVRAEVHGKVGEGREASAEHIADTTAAAPDTSAAVPKTVVPLTADRPPAAPAAPDPGKAVPDRLPPSATDLSAGPERVDREMAEAKVTETQLRRANEPAFTKALGGKRAAERHSAAAPGRLRAHETGELRAATADARRTGTAAMGAMGAQRALAGQRVGAGKAGAKGRDEERRARVTAILQGVFDTMKTEVESVLSGLDQRVDEQFAQGEKEARDAFTAEHRRKMDDYKDRRYSGPLGAARWVKDLFAGLPAEADRLFDQARDGYLRRMRQVISDVATTIGAELNRAKRRIAQGREEIRRAVLGLPEELRAVGREAAAEFSDRFAELTQSVDDKGTELVDVLATRYTDALKSVDDEIAAEREKNKGLVAKAVDAVKGVIDTILELRRLLLAVLAKAAQAVMMILGDPVGFLRKLVAAVGAGLRQFLRNIGTHLRQGVLSWLLGRAAEAGIHIPAKFDARGVLGMLASMLGLTWPSIRARITRRVPERAVAAAETAVPLVAEVRRRGVAGMWDELRARVGDLRKNLMDKVVEYVTPTIVTAGITWLLSLLNPASAFVRAVKLIIDIVTFVVTQGRRIIEFVNAVLDAVIAIARGGSGGVPALVEKALARSIPALLGFLAALLGVGGVAARVKQIVQAMARPVNRAVDWVIDKIIGLVRRLWAKLRSSLAGRRGRGAARPQRPPDRARPGPAQGGPLAAERASLSMSGEGHTLTATPGRGVELASDVGSVRGKAGKLIGKLERAKAEDPRKQAKIAALRTIVATARTVESIVAEAAKEKGRKPDKLLQYPGFADAFRELRERIVAYGSDFGTKDLTDELLGGDRAKLEKEVRGYIVAAARRHDRAGKYGDVIKAVAAGIQGEKNVTGHTVFKAPASLGPATAESKDYPVWKGKDSIAGSAFHVVADYRADSGRDYNILAGDQDAVSKKAIKSLRKIGKAARAGGGQSAAEFRAGLRGGMLRAGHEVPYLRSMFVGWVIERYVADQVRGVANIKPLGNRKPGQSVPDFLVNDIDRDIPVDVTGGSQSSVADHMKRPYLSRESLIITYPSIATAVLDEVFKEPGPERKAKSTSVSKAKAKAGAGAKSTARTNVTPKSGPAPAPGPKKT
ncbi:HPC2 multi-domain protein [Streptomyces sp. NPDC020141]|uniref:HPC2 multi-domain protein n=1 Tax=Streptomyces sp. NPDC020141 TaxID=3365065 RepID=UPI0037875F9E